MGRPGDLQYEAEILDLGSKLQVVATGLRKIEEGQQIEADEAEKLSWIAGVTKKIQDNFAPSRETSKELSMMETKLAARFYKQVNLLQIPLDTGFSKRLYTTLASGGREFGLRREELKRAQKLYQSMANSFLISFRGDNGQL